jgi:hypothetical protein
LLTGARGVATAASAEQYNTGELGTLPWALQDPVTGAVADTLIEITPRDYYDVPSCGLAVTSNSPLDGSAPISLDCEIDSVFSAPGAALRLHVLSENDTPLHEGVHLIDLPAGTTKARFVLAPDLLDDGHYVARFSLRLPKDEASPWFELNLRKITRQGVSKKMEEVPAILESLSSHLSTVESASFAAPYARMRLLIAADVASRAKTFFDEGSWWRAADGFDYAAFTAAAVRAELAFSGGASELHEPTSNASLEDLTVRHGSFHSGDKPVFLFGAVGWEGLANDLTRLRDFGLNLAAFPIDPAEAVSSPQGSAGHLGRSFQAAKAANIAVMIQATPSGKSSPTSAPWLLAGRQRISAASAQAGEEDQALRSLAAYLEDQSMLASVSFIHQPQFRFRDEATRRRFVEFLTASYGDRNALNFTWKSRFRNINDFKFGMDFSQPAFRFDWHSFQQSVATAYMRKAIGNVREVAPSIPIQLTLADSAFLHNETGSGVDHERLTRLVEISGGVTSELKDHPYYALDHPRSTMHYALLQSLAPDQPVINSALKLFPEGLSTPDHERAYAHSTIWEGVMAGLDGAALWAWDDNKGLTFPSTGMLARPAGLEGFAKASIDVNRMADLVSAFQQAPGDVAILWSMPSKIYGRGEAYLTSLTQAYEGASFGGQKIRFVSESQCVQNGLQDVRLLIIPKTPAMSDEAFKVVNAYVKGGGAVVRTGMAVAYTPRGKSRQEVLDYSINTISVRGAENPTAYLHAMETAYSMEVLSHIPRAVNYHGYLIEGVKTRHLVHEGDEYLYVLNIRRDGVMCHLPEGARNGRDLIAAQDVSFPLMLEPLQPMLIRLGAVDEGVLVADVEPIRPNVPTSNVGVRVP